MTATVVPRARRRLAAAVPPPVKVRLVEAEVARFRRRHGSSACFAPLMQLHLLPDGDIRACCRNDRALGNITEQRLPEIWAGANRRAMIDDLAAGRFAGGCSNCGDEVAREGRRGSYPAVFDHWGRRLGGVPDVAGMPNRMEFNLSNICNLQCIQCNGELSSSIRIHRDKRPPLGTIYDDTFFEDLAPFLLGLEHANFAGGEPFLGRENFRVWEMIADLVPDLDCTVCTNVTQWNARVERVLDSLNMNIIFSLDGISKRTYEAIRIGSDFDVVAANMERFRSYAEDRGTAVTINHCLMPQNYAEFGDLLQWAEERGIYVNVSVVRAPEHASIYHLPADELHEVAAVLAAQDAEVTASLRLNRATWVQETARIQTWAADGERVLRIRTRRAEAAATEAAAVVEAPAPEPDQPPEPAILGFPIAAPAVAPAEVPDHGPGVDDHPDLQVGWVLVGPGDVVISASPSISDLLGIEAHQLEGRPVTDLREETFARFGDLVRHETLLELPDLSESRSHYRDHVVHHRVEAVRDAGGTCQEARITVSVWPEADALS